MISSLTKKDAIAVKHAYIYTYIVVWLWSEMHSGQMCIVNHVYRILIQFG